MAEARGGAERVLAVGVRPAAGAGLLLLFAATLLLSALLLFWLQPMFTRMVLPRLGGSPAVWNTAMVFFQTALLAGYAYAHALARWLGRRQQVLLHLGLLALAAQALPIGIDAGWQPPAEGSPAVWLIGLLTLSLGLPFVAIAASAPLLQLWFAGSGHSRAGDPYFLYGASNCGSITALLGYPLLLEPTLDLAQQSRAWSLGYGLLVLLVGATAAAVWRRPAPVPVSHAERAGAPPWRLRLRWLALAAVPSALLLAVTAHITTDLAAVPLLWVLPLALYLLTFVLTFARRPWLAHGWMVKAQPFLLIPLALLFSGNLAFWIALPLHLGAFFVSAMVCHGELARSRPGAGQLTGFYLWLAAGGMLGGVLAALLAPLLFEGVWEYPLALAAACLLRPRLAVGAGRRALDLLLPLAVLALVLLQARWRALELPDLGPTAVLLVPAALLLYGMATRPVRLGLGLAAALAAALFARDTGEIVLRDRSFFGVYTVKQDPAGFRVLVHGTTIHGAQQVDPARRREPLTYYLADGPLGQLFASEIGQAARSVGAVGLGVGTVACYRSPGQRWTFYEIDPLIERIARDPRHFHYLADCAPDAEVVLGDARLSLRAMPAGSFDLLILDAFSSDAIPVHLLTAEALALYLDKLAPGGVIALHVSNRNLDLAPVVAALVRAAGAVGWQQTHRPAAPTGAAAHAYRNLSSWIVIARQPGDLAPLVADGRWSPLEGEPGARPWSDAFSDIVGALRWRF